LIGPTGGGKTSLARYLVKALERILYIHDMGTMSDPQASILGTHRLVNGESQFDYASFTEHIQDKRAVILLDELSRAPITANNILFPALDDRRELPVEMADSKHARNIKIHEDCVFFATANIGAQYTGTHTLDRALVDRFFMVEIPYMQPDIESKVLTVRCKIDKKEADKIAAVAGEIRNMYLREELADSVSHRHTLEMGDLVKDGADFILAAKTVLFPLFEGSEADGERATVLGVITKF